MTRLWLVTADYHGYDEYDAFVVRAPTLLRAHEMVLERTANFRGATIEEIPLEGDEEVILGSFNAG